MKIAIFTDTFLPQTNGVVTMVKTHALELAKMGHKVAIVASKPPKGQKKEVLEEFTARGIEVCFIPAFGLPTYKEIRVATPTWIQSLRVVRKFKPDIIHSHTNFGVGWEAVNCAKVLKVPLVGHHHTFWTDYLHHVKLDKDFMIKPTHYFTASFYNRCDLIYSPSKSLMEELIQNGVKKRVKVLPNSINLNYLKISKKKEDLKKKAGIDGKKTVVYFGRISKEKSINVLLKAFAGLANEMDDVRLMIVGDGPALDELKSRAKKLKIDKKVIFTGMLKGKKLFETIAACDIFASASASENQPMSFLEAMALGLPMMCADAKGAPELCHHNVNGLLFAPKDYRKMADSLSKIFKNPEMAREMGKESKKIAENHSNEHVLKELINDYKLLKKEKNEQKAKSLS
ncbi:glycosyltransferase family 4 protein [candidate division WS5 bacterium]|uniref:Glycosyltransferase family 4 protein n=1 Tax=candidate division WS5 bacterium TaxID=2093353 RepID=A0A419DFM0_9BACT|nr:MAG: glycosyltransferase family 4 protein [candidate division WS5 bacterium]